MYSNRHDFIYSMLKANVSSEDRRLITKFIFSDSGNMTRETSAQSDEKSTEAEGELPEFFCGLFNYLFRGLSNIFSSKPTNIGCMDFGSGQGMLNLNPGTYRYLFLMNHQALADTQFDVR